ncbi:MAG: bifunctional D-glycero-beta-D-manno-heptose-7-phosphate kinase/D-glycero-beta-D-manno-heptose 1-phosphate adenylyltransferase HldE [Gammaproteobacteria bacterium]|nr:bifunctional D-glycero-beta-D-manno-heptose-7-phosphate kinase/D-glycero-beta-D-manno-heptose 1-phosphate adenylyltransferase HldE [Gammaproteobacteria bacterium]
MTMQHLTKLPDFSKAAVLVAGDIMLDRYWFGETNRISPEAPVPVVSIRQTEARPGGAGNVALNIAALGAQTTLIGMAGKDEAGQILRDQLTRAHVTHDIQSFPNIPTITKLRIISRHQQLIRMDFEETFNALDSTSFIEAFKKALANTQVVILSDYAKGSLVVAQQFIQLAKQAGKRILVDPKSLDFNLYRGADVITPNLREFEAIVGACQHETDIMTKAQNLLTQHDIGALLLTRGERGMTLITRGNTEEIHFPAHAREVFDVTGAGDTVIAVLGAALAAGTSLPEAMALANQAAGIVVGKLGAATVTRAELEASLKNTHTIQGGVLDENQLELSISKARLNGERIVFTNGCFDILHAGHVTYLQQARQLGDRLVVAINDDASVKRLKGASRPINSVEQRMAVLASLGVVDWVTSFSDDTPERLLHKIKPDILVKGGDYTPDGVIGAAIVRAYGGDVRVLGCVRNLSTSAIIDRVIQQQQT